MTPALARGMLPIAALLGVLAASPAIGGYLLVDADGEQTLVSKGKLKELSADGQGPQSAFDLGTARAWMANPDKRVYWEGTIEELCSTFRQTAAAMARAAEQQMDDQIARLPPDQRAKAEELRSSLRAKRAAENATEAAKPGVIKLEKTAETETIAGQPTRKYRVLVDGKLYQENWLTTDPALGREFALDKAAAAMSRVSACAEAGDPSAPKGKGIDEGEIYRELYLHGWPLKSVSYATGAPVPRSEIRTIEKREVPDADFAPPPGFRQAPLAQVMFGAPE